MEELAEPIPAYQRGERSQAEGAESVVFLHHEGESESHNAPRRQYLFILNGSLEFEVPSGDRRTFGPGDVVLVEDVTGEGHTTRGTADFAVVHLRGT